MLELINNENLFLIVLGLIWIIGAVIQDMRRREVDNLWNFSFIAFALAYRGFVSVWTGNYWFILNGVLGFGVFFALGNLFYYSRLFAGGDAKLLMALGTVLPFSYSGIVNFKIFGYFILLFLIGGSVYSLIYSLILMFINFNGFCMEFKKHWKIYQRIFLIGLLFSVFWIALGFIFDFKFAFIGIVVFLFPVLYIFSKSIEESCLVKKIDSRNVTLGDWLYKDITVNGKKIKASWDGVSGKQLKLIKKSKKNILIKYGIPFTPSFLIGFIGLIVLMWKFKSLFLG